MSFLTIESPFFSPPTNFPFRIRPKLDELTSLQARHLLKPSMDESPEEEQQIEQLSGELTKLISSTHRHIQCIRSSLNYGHKKQQLLTQNVIGMLLNELQDVTQRFRTSQNDYLKELNRREARSNAFFDHGSFSDIDLGGESQVESFDNFLNPKNPAGQTASAQDLEDEQIDEYFQKPVSGRLMTDQQLLLFEEENTRLIESREREVSKIVKSIMDLQDIFKDLAGMVHEQGTVLDRIDYNVEATQSKVQDGMKQLAKAEAYQKKNRKMCIILIEAGLVLFLLLVLIIKMS